MNPLIQFKKTTPLFLVAFGLACFALVPGARAVSPPPDGGYPGGNTAEGQKALLSLTTGGFNTALGFLSLRSNAIGQFNTAVGAGTLLANTGDQNTATGAGALLSNTGTQNTANGAFALFSDTGGGGNTANGAQALQSNTIGGNNTAIGAGALFFTTSSSNNTAVGANAGNSVTTASNVICIGANGADVSDSCFIGNIRDVTTNSNNAIPVLIDAAGQLGTMSSSRRFKKEIKPMDDVSDAILALKPVTFHYKSDKTNRPEFGLIAEEVAEVNPDLVVREKNGEIYSVRYEAVNAMLLNEFLKEHRKVQEQGRKLQQQETTIAQQRKDFEATISELKKGMETLAVRSKEQDVKIQKVSNRIELNAAAKQLAVSK